nr:hypothetical protein [Bacteroidota bacterium]
MNKYVILISAFILTYAFNLQAQSLKKVKIENMEDSVSYAIGMDIADNFTKQNIKVDPLIMAKAMLDHTNKSSMMTVEQKQQVLTVFQQKM